ncbi:MAG: hypothetical protein IKZ45_07760 [Fibrobacter sp.]|nr:hypothetical protein [Fibrobacter sp.]
MNKLFSIPISLFFAVTLAFAQEETEPAVDTTATSNAPEMAGESESAAEHDSAAEPDFVAVPALAPEDARLFEDLGKICSKRFCAVEIFMRNGTYAQMAKSKSSLSNEYLIDYDASHSEGSEFVDKDAQKQAIAEQMKQMCSGKEFCTLEATFHGPSFTLASLTNVTANIRPKNQVVPRYNDIHYSNDTEVEPFDVEPVVILEPTPAPVAPTPATTATRTESGKSQADQSVQEPAPQRRVIRKKKEFSHAIAFSLGFLGEEYYGEIGTDPANALELFLRYNFKWAKYKYATFTAGAGIAFRTNTLDFDEDWRVSNFNYDYYGYDGYEYKSAYITEEGSINYQNLTLDIPISIRFGSMFYGSLTLDLRKPFCEWYEYHLDFYRNYSSYSFDYDESNGFDFFDSGDTETGLWIGTGFTYNSLGIELQVLVVNFASEDRNHIYRPIFYGGFSYSTRITVEYTF